MINKNHIDISRLEKLSIIQLNKLVQFMNMYKYYFSAGMRTLIYNRDVMNEIAEYTNTHNMIRALNINKHRCGSDTISLIINDNDNSKVKVSYNNQDGKWYEREELVDALFDAVIDNLNLIISG